MRKIGIIVFDYVLGVSTSLINTAIELERAGYEVHIFTNRSFFELSPIDFKTDHIITHIIDDAPNEIYRRQRRTTLERLNSKLNKETLLHRTVRSLLRWPYNKLLGSLRYYIRYRKDLSHPTPAVLQHYVEQFFPRLNEFYAAILPHIDEQFACFIGAERHGLIAATLVSDKCSLNRRIPVIYYSLELILPGDDPSMGGRVLNALEREISRSSSTIVIQDKTRAQYLMRDYGVREEQFVYIPVSGLRERYEQKNDYFRMKFGIGEEKKVVLQAGSIKPGMMSLELAQAAQEWDDDMVLVLHTFDAEHIDAEYLHQINQLTEAKKVYLNLQAVSWDELPMLLSSADVGLAFYWNRTHNYIEIGNSSNKLVQYLQVGLPVVAIDFPTLKEVIERFKCGECVKEPGEIRAALRTIFADYSWYKSNAFTCYDEKYKFMNYFNPLLVRIHELEA
jgi:glycosyltransferase involved in cell wall biosynthesis